MSVMNTATPPAQALILGFNSISVKQSATKQGIAISRMVPSVILAMVVCGFILSPILGSSSWVFCLLCGRGVLR